MKLVSGFHSFCQASQTFIILIHVNTFVCCWESEGKLSHLERHEVSVSLAGGLSAHMM